MSTLRNHVQLIGRLGADAEIKTSNQGRPYAQLRFATNEFTKTSSGEWKENTQWHNLILWGEITKKIGQNGKKGSQFLVQGTLQYREFTDSQEIKRTIAEIRVNKIIPLQNSTRQTIEEENLAKDQENTEVPF